MGSPRNVAQRRIPTFSEAGIHKSSWRRSSSTSTSWCRATLFRMLERVFTLDRSVQWDDFVMFPIDLGRDPHVGASLSHSRVPQAPQRHPQRSAAHVSGKLHATSTSSRTKCKRISLGRGMVSSK